MSLLLRGGTVVTGDAEWRVGQFDIRVQNERITEVKEQLESLPNEQIIDAHGWVVMPGLVQAHVHLCQTLGRGFADDMELLPWLQTRIWPMEGALQANDLRAAARLGLAELLLGGTTTILDMGTVRHTEVLFEEAEKSGIRYIGGKVIMDAGDYPGNLSESTDEAMRASVQLCEQWHGAANGRLRYAFSPRFVLSCSEQAMRESTFHARRMGALIHTHASENSEEIRLVRERSGMDNVAYLHSLGLSGPDVILAHGVWLTPDEISLLSHTETRIVHCPSANLKLASGIAPIADLLEQGVSVALGADGAPCNNNLDGFHEMRLAALLHKVRSGCKAISARTALQLATRFGAIALGLDDVGAIVPGFKADLICLDLNKPHAWPQSADVVSRIVYSARSSDVRMVMVDGRVVVENATLSFANVDDILAESEQAAQRVWNRVCPL